MFSSIWERNWYVWVIRSRLTELVFFSIAHDLGLSLSFESPVALLSTPITILLLCVWILLTTGNFTFSIKGKSSIRSCNRFYGLWLLMTALASTYCWYILRLLGSKSSVFMKSLLSFQIEIWARSCGEPWTWRREAYNSVRTRGKRHQKIDGGY